MQYDIQKIDDARVLRGWTRQKLAILAKVGPGTITRIWKKGQIAKPDTYKRLAEALGMTMQDICIPENHHARHRR